MYFGQIVIKVLVFCHLTPWRCPFWAETCRCVSWKWMYLHSVGVVFINLWKCTVKKNVKITANVFCSITFPRNKCSLWNKLEKYSTDGKIIRRMRFACWITKATETHRICNTYCYYMATMTLPTRLSVTFYVHCLSCFSPKLRYNSTRLHGVTYHSILRGHYLAIKFYTLWHSVPDVHKIWASPQGDLWPLYYLWLASQQSIVVVALFSSLLSRFGPLRYVSKITAKYITVFF